MQKCTDRKVNLAGSLTTTIPALSHEATAKPGIDDVHTVDDEELLGDNDCHLCPKNFVSTDTLITHLQEDHSDYHQKNDILKLRTIFRSHVSHIPTHGRLSN